MDILLALTELKTTFTESLFHLSGPKAAGSIKLQTCYHLTHNQLMTASQIHLQWIQTNTLQHGICLSVVVDGCDDFYLPSACELELCYRNLKQCRSNNYTFLNSGANLHSIPIGKPYTITDPPQTTVTKFVTGNAEAFDSTTYYRSSTEYSLNSQLSLTQCSSNGIQQWIIKTNRYSVRAVRRITIV